ncbi:HD family hydrolase [Candidatus Woesearchaeota archaeon]|nr:HD family hydrolase [Candidatus Woesearchaeota archaeon]
MKQLKELLEVFLTIQVSKELPRQGFLYSGFKRNEADSVAAHAYSVTIFSYLLARQLKEEGWDIDPEKALKIALVHDLGETITGDIGTYAKDLARDRFEKVENQAFRLLIRNMLGKDELIELFEAYQNLDTVEAQIVKFADALDAFVQGFNTPSADLADLIKTTKYIARKKIQNKELSKMFDEAMKMITDKKVTVYKGHIGGE